MPKVLHPILLILANATHRELAAQVQYLNVENEIILRIAQAAQLLVSVVPVGNRPLRDHRGPQRREPGAGHPDQRTCCTWRVGLACT